MPSITLHIPHGHRLRVRAELRADGLRLADSGDRASWRGAAPPIVGELLATGWAVREIEDLPALLHAAIARHGSATAAARAIGCTYRTLRLWLTGQSEPVSVWAIRRIQRAAGSSHKA